MVLSGREFGTLAAFDKGTNLQKGQTDDFLGLVDIDAVMTIPASFLVFWCCFGHSMFPVQSAIPL